MWNFLFEDNYNGGFFYIQCDTIEEAWDIIDDSFGADAGYMRYTGEYHDDETAEVYGFDTY